MSDKVNPFTPATKDTARLRLLLAGGPGSGKTYTALAVACGLGERVALVDTERGSADKYSDVFSFDRVDLAAAPVPRNLGRYHPERFIRLIAAAADNGYNVLILDSISHAWAGEGGILEIVDGKAARGANKYTCWSEPSKLQARLVDTILGAPMHVIATVRSKIAYVLEANDKGKQVPRKVGTAPVQREGLEYEFDVVGELSADHVLTVTKSRCAELTDAQIDRPGADLAETLGRWLGNVPDEIDEPPAEPAEEETEADG